MASVTKLTVCWYLCLSVRLSVSVLIICALVWQNVPSEKASLAPFYLPTSLTYQLPYPDEGKNGI